MLFYPKIGCFYCVIATNVKVSRDSYGLMPVCLWHTHTKTFSHRWAYTNITAMLTNGESLESKHLIGPIHSFGNIRCREDNSIHALRATLGPRAAWSIKQHRHPIHHLRELATRTQGVSNGSVTSAVWICHHNRTGCTLSFREDLTAWNDHKSGQRKLIRGSTTCNDQAPSLY